MVEVDQKNKPFKKFHSRTRFCEIDLPAATLKFVAENFGSYDVVQLPVDLAR